MPLMILQERLKDRLMDNFKFPIDLVITEDPNSCPFDGLRTELLEIRDDYTVETCTHCNKLFNFWSD